MKCYLQIVVVAAKGRVGDCEGVGDDAQDTLKHSIQYNGAFSRQTGLNTDCRWDATALWHFDDTLSLVYGIHWVGLQQ